MDSLAWQQRLPQALALLALAAGLLALAFAPFLAVRWMETPYIGAAVGPGMLFYGAPGLAGSGLSVNFGDRLLAVDGRPLHSAADLEAALARRSVGDAATLTVRRAGGDTVDLPVTLARFPTAARLAAFYLPYLTGLLYLCAGVWAFVLRRDRPGGRVFASFAAALALTLGLLFDLVTTQRLVWLWTVALALTGGTGVALALVFPQEDPLVWRRPLIIALGPLLATLAGLATLLALSYAAQTLAYALALRAMLAGLLAALAFCLGWWLIRAPRVAAPENRAAVRLTGYAALLSFTPPALGLLAAGLGWGRAWPYLWLFLAIFPIAAGIALRRDRLAQIDGVLSLGVSYVLLAALISVGYALIAAGLGLGLGRYIAPGNPLAQGLVFFVLAMALIPLREYTQRLVDGAFFRGKPAYQERLQAFSGELTRATDLPGIAAALRGYVGEALAPAAVHLFLYDPVGDQYAAVPDASGRSTSDLRFASGSGLARRLSEPRATPLRLDVRDRLPAALEPDRARLALLGARVFAPLPGRQRLAGWLALGPRLSGEPYTPAQIAYLAALCDQAALAIERAQVAATMTNRVREMNILTRVAQGISVTLSLDDILELVYAQTTQIIPAQHFRIMLYDPATGVYRYAFYLEGEERLAARETQPVPAGQALEQEIIRQRRPIVCDDYNLECHRRGILAPRVEMLAYLGVPLNAGSETIGALSLGSGDPGVQYSPDHQALLQAVAGQVAGALVKARLLDETERRARQLAALNEVTRQLTATLETGPLLQSVLQSAVRLVNGAGGRLFLLDGAAEGLSLRAQAGAATGGEPGEAAQAALRSGTPVTGENLLALPLLVNERVTGVIEVAGPLDGAPFTGDDRDLLSAFAAQAAVALENARLYTSTDQALAARVEELSVMQRIDRELNASLDITAAMRITLEWAMRQSHADAGLVGVLQDGGAGVKIMAWQGYTRELEPYQSAPLPADAFHLSAAIADGLPVRRALDGRETFTLLLEGGRSQAILPIRRETNSIGLLLLESAQPQPLSDEAMAFLTRLSDHASVAISNAQLYAAVQQANLAKSDFVSFVAHELKNPMTSVKGYTELIAAGAVGPVTEAQGNFLSTIRANIERMNTLVSDLNDMSKIEVGRLRLDFKSLRLSDAIETVVRSTRRQIEEKQQSLALAIPADLPPVWADRVRLEQVLVNLVSNANKYTPAGGAIQIAAERCPNTWDLAGAAEVVHIWVEDNGIGISEEDQKKIFQKFFRSEDSKAREATGTGLGLNITRSLVEMQGGKIWFESEFRRGTTFHFTVPVAEG